MEILAATFELDLPTVHSIICKMIINEELMVSPHWLPYSQSGCSEDGGSQWGSGEGKSTLGRQPMEEGVRGGGMGRQGGGRVGDEASPAP